jgi:hypothetical protein
MPNRAQHVPISPVDAAWLRMDSPTNQMVITTVLRFDGPLDDAGLVETFEGLLEHRRFRMRVVRDRRALTGAAWEPDPDFDLATHVRRVRLPAPGDEAALCAFISARMSTPLDRTRPLWQIDVIDGIGGPSGKGTALLVRVHHAVGDGVALVRLLLGVSHAPKDRTPVEVGLAKPAKAHGPRELAARGAAQAETMARLLLLPSDAKTKLRGELGVRKLAAFSKGIPLDRVKAIAKAHHGHVNDLLAAAVAGAVRAYLPEQKDTRALVPVFLRGDDGDEGNHFGMAYLPIPSGEPDRGARVRAVKREMDTIKNAPDATVAFVILGAMGLASPRLERIGIDIFTRKASMLVTNVPGPAGAVKLAGVDVRDMVVWAPTSGSIGLGFSLLTYAGELRLGVAADANCIPDAGALVTAFEQELDALAADVGI